MFSILGGLVTAATNVGVNLFSKGLLSALVITQISKNNAKVNLSLKG